MTEFPSKISFTSGVIGIISIFTPIIFHLSPNSVYNFWSWGFILFFSLNSNEIGTTYNTEVEFLIPGFLSLILIVISSVLILVITLKRKKSQIVNVKYHLIGGIVMIASPLVLMAAWQIIYIIVRDYPTFWGVNYYWPSVAIFLQLIAGTLALLSNMKMRVK